MKLSENKVIQALDGLATFALILYIVFFIVQLFNSSPKSSHAVKSYKVYNVRLDRKYKETNPEDNLKSWFNNQVVVQETNKGLVHLRFKSYAEMFSFSSILFQVSIFVYWLLIGAAIYFARGLFRSFRKDEVFTQKNAWAIMASSLILISLPVFRWISQEFFLNCVNTLHINDSNYTFNNGENLLTSETIIGLVLMAFSWVFKIGVDIKKENESFV
ncbi:DUF2975 domain-containing protein [Pedobacter sp. KR3-3]|uniref:DUF2975 domain-containing protein n=1 Tax=Pedobacter albus TaxID=3113905 RepID=A0ABU7I4Y9_9SPHI|nr:DUF2975 domain-containing protein [Pedobacter sp. KR3-3]MEE1944396.1 DUF2975 domain-containing protein [Pedobacter sp. KR3-3]